MRFKDKVAIVTGGASGLGRAIALHLAKDGANVVIADVNLESANKVVDEIKALNARAITTKTDVAKLEEVKQMVKAALDEFGQIDMLVNCAGGGAREKETSFHESTPQIWDWVIGRNLMGTLNCSWVVLPHMIERRSGSIVNIGSTSAVTGGLFKQGTELAAAKAGVVAFTKGLAKEVGQLGIRVNCVSPGAMKTMGIYAYPEREAAAIKKGHLGRMGEPNEVGNVVVFLLSDEASFVTGAHYLADGAESLGS